MCWDRKVLTETCEAKVNGWIGPGRNDDRSMRVLSRMSHWTESGVEYKADQRHAEIIESDLGLGRGSKGVTTPGIPPKKGDRTKMKTCWKGAKV